MVLVPGFVVHDQIKINHDIFLILRIFEKKNFCSLALAILFLIVFSMNFGNNKLPGGKGWGMGSESHFDIDIDIY